MLISCQLSRSSFTCLWVATFNHMRTLKFKSQTKQTRVTLVPRFWRKLMANGKPNMQTVLTDPQLITQDQSLLKPIREASISVILVKRKCLNWDPDFKKRDSFPFH